MGVTFLIIFVYKSITNNMNHIIYNTSGEVQYAPDFQHTFISLKKCDVCENDVDQDLTVTLKDCGTTYCAGCAKMLDIEQVYIDCTYAELQEIYNQLKPIL